MRWRGRSGFGSRGCRRRRPRWPARWPCWAMGPIAGTRPRWPGSSSGRRHPRRRCSREWIFCARTRRCDSCIRSFETPSTRPARRMSAPMSTPRRRPSWRLRELRWSRSELNCSVAPPETVEDAVAHAAGCGTRGRGAGGSRQRGQVPEPGAGGAEQRCRARRAATRPGRGGVEPGLPDGGREAARGGEPPRGPRAPRVGRARSRTGALLGWPGGGGGAGARAGTPGAAGRRRSRQAAAGRADRELRQAARALPGRVAAGRFDHGEAGGGPGRPSPTLYPGLR